MKFLFLRALKQYSTLLLTGILFFNFACEDDDHDDHAHAHDEGHTDAEGFVLKDGSPGNPVVYRQFKGDVTVDNLTVAVDDEKPLMVVFLDDDEAEIQHDDDENETEESVLQVSVTSGAEFATVAVHEHDDSGSTTEEEHEMMIEITGISAGETFFSLTLMHGTHADYQSTVDVKVTVE